MLLRAAICIGCVTARTAVPVIDISSLRAERADPVARRRTVEAITNACIEVGFLHIENHGVSEELQERLDRAFRCFVAQPREVKRRIEMAVAGPSWRGYFEVGEELTKGVADQKEGIYFAAERPGDSRPLHGPNLFPDEAVAPGMRAAVLEYMAELSELSKALLDAIGEGLGLPADVFGEHFAEPTTLFRCFHYPPHDEQWGEESTAVGEHTDMGFLTVLRQDDSGGLQVREACTNEWVDVPPVPHTFVVNLGDCLERFTGGLLRATAHRVNKRLGATAGRFSYPFFFDPSFDARMRSCTHLLPEPLAARAAQRVREAPERWDGRDLQAFEGPYSDFILSKVSMVFPQLAEGSGVKPRR